MNNAAPKPQRQPRENRRNRAAMAEADQDSEAASNVIPGISPEPAFKAANSIQDASIVDIDGGALEGGGQVLRNTVSFSCLLHRPVRVYNVRAGRSKPGLRPQHLTGIMLTRDVCQGRLEGGSVGSTEIQFHPGNIQHGDYTADTGTAGSICLLLQVAIPCLVYADGPTNLTLKGGTNADMAPQLDHMTMVFKPIAEKFGMKFDCRVIRRGYYPKGGGEVMVTCHPTKQLSAVTMTDRGDIKQIYGISFVAGVLPVRVAHIMAKVAESVIHKEYKDVPVNIDVVKEVAAIGTGTGIVLVAETTTGCYLGGSALGKKGKQAEQVGQEAAEELINNLYHGGCVDDYVQDQAKFKITEINKGATLIECDGIGLVNSQVGS